MEPEQLYSRYFKSVYLYAMRLSGDAQLAEDITGETFFRAIQGVERFRGDCDIRVWLCQIAKNCYFSYLKKNRRAPRAEERDLQEVADPAATAEEAFCRKEELGQIRRLLHELPEPYREVFMWRVFGELSFREIGDLYGKTDNWACVTYHRARKRIQQGLEEMEHE